MDLHAYFGNASTSAEKTDSISDSSLSFLMKIVIETNLEVIVDKGTERVEGSPSDYNYYYILVNANVMHEVPRGGEIKRRGGANSPLCPPLNEALQCTSRHTPNTMPHP